MMTLFVFSMFVLMFWLTRQNFDRDCAVKPVQPPQIIDIYTSHYDDQLGGISDVEMISKNVFTSELIWGTIEK